MKKTLTVLIIATTIGLTACSHKNPLETEPKEETAKFLKSASTYAEVKMNYKIREEDHGGIYAACMLGRKGGPLAASSFCPKFYSYMIEYAKHVSSEFSDITIEDLTNKKAFAYIENMYIYGSEEIQF